MKETRVISIFTLFYEISRKYHILNCIPGPIEPGRTELKEECELYIFKNFLEEKGIVNRK